MTFSFPVMGYNLVDILSYIMTATGGWAGYMLIIAAFIIAFIASLRWSKEVAFACAMSLTFFVSYSVWVLGWVGWPTIVIVLIFELISVSILALQRFQ